MKSEDIVLGDTFKEKIFSYQLSSEEEIGNTYVKKNGEVVDCHISIENGEMKDYTEIQVSGDGGECGFRVLGLTRQQAVHELEKLHTNPQVRFSLLCQELIESMDRFEQKDGNDLTLYMDEKPRAQACETYQQIKGIKNSLDQLYDNARTRLNELEITLEDGPSNENILSNIQAYQLQELDGELIRNILSQEKEYKQVLEQLRDNDEIFQAYINCYNRPPNGLFLGTKSMVCIAQSMGIGIILWAPIPVKNFILRTPIAEEIKQQIVRDRNVVIIRRDRLQFEIGFVRNHQYIQMPLDVNAQKLKLLLERHDYQNDQITNLETRRLLARFVISNGGRPNLWRMIMVPPSTPEKGSINVILKGGHYNFLIESRIDPGEQNIEQLSSTRKKRKELEPLEQENDSELSHAPTRRKSTRPASIAASGLLAEFFSRSSGSTSDHSGMQFRKG